MMKTAYEIDIEKFPLPDRLYKAYTGTIIYCYSRLQVENATFVLSDTKIIWYDGIVDGGIWQYGYWHNGMWKKGVWKDGVWENGVWLNGVWKRGEWCNGIWEGGKWYHGVWHNGKINESEREFLYTNL